MSYKAVTLEHNTMYFYGVYFCCQVNSDFTLVNKTIDTSTTHWTRLDYFTEHWTPRGNVC